MASFDGAHTDKVEAIVAENRRGSLIQGVLWSCRSKFKSRQKQVEKQNDKVHHDDNCLTESPTAKEISKKRRLSFLRKRRKYSNNKDEQLNLLNDKETNKSKNDNSSKQHGKEDFYVDEHKTASNTNILKDYKSNVDKCALQDDSEKKLLTKTVSYEKLDTPSKEKKTSNENLDDTILISAANATSEDLVCLLEKKDERHDLVKIELEINENKPITKISDNILILDETSEKDQLPTGILKKTEDDFNKPKNSCHEQFILHNYTENLTQTLMNDSVQEASDFLKKTVTSHPCHLDNESNISISIKVDINNQDVRQPQLSNDQLVFSSNVNDLSTNRVKNDINLSEIIKEVDYNLNEEDKNHNSSPSLVLVSSHDDLSDVSIDIKAIHNREENASENKSEAEMNGSLIDKNHNFLRDKHLSLRKNNSDRPLSGYAEKLAELLADEDDLEFLDSDEETSESKEIIKEVFNCKLAATVSSSSIEHTDEVKPQEESKPALNQTTHKRKTKRGRARGDRPMSLFEQDMLNDILNVTNKFECEDDEKSIKSNNTEDYGDTDGIETDDEILEDEILPVKATIEILGQNILPQRKFSSNDSDISFDDFMRSHNSSFGYISNDRPLTLRKAAVLDAGCGILKAGICGERKPSCYCPSVIGVPRRFSQDVSKMKKPYYVGDEAWEVAGMLQIEHPIKQEINDWSDVTSIIEHLMEYELKINDNEHPIMMTEMGLTSKKHREKLTEIMFEQFGVPSFYLANQSVLALYSMGMMSGVCLSSGFYNTQAIPIYEGHTIPHGISQLDIGGEQVTNYLGRLLQQSAQSRSFSTSSEKLVLNSMKQSLCYVSLDAKKEEARYKAQANLYESYVLPDGQEIEVGAERFIAPEVLFDPHLLGLNQLSTTQLVTHTLELVNSELRDIFLPNVLVTGGNTKLKGYSARLEKELAIENPKVKLKCADDPLLATWIGGSIISSISAFRDQWMTIDQYTEHGSKLVHMICF